MPLSKKRNADRMRQSRLHVKLMQPKVDKVVPLRCCTACGEGRVVDEHHIDSNHDNNVNTNRVDLCPTCHAVIHRQKATLEELYYKQPVQPNKLIPLDDETRDMFVDAYAEDYKANPWIDADGNLVYDVT